MKKKIFKKGKKQVLKRKKIVFQPETNIEMFYNNEIHNLKTKALEVIEKK